MIKTKSPEINKRTRPLITLVLAAALVFTLAACERSKTEAPVAALELTREAVSAEDGMILLDHPGPKGQLRLSDGNTEFYCDTPGMFRAIRQPEGAGRITKAFAQPFDEREWGSFADGWADAESLVYVVGSRTMGAMGPTFVPFREKERAHAFMQANGGKVMAYADITPEFLEAHAKEVREQMREQGAGSMSGHSMQPQSGSDDTHKAMKH